MERHLHRKFRVVFFVCVFLVAQLHQSVGHLQAQGQGANDSEKSSVEPLDLAVLSVDDDHLEIRVDGLLVPGDRVEWRIGFMGENILSGVVFCKVEGGVEFRAPFRAAQAPPGQYVIHAKCGGGTNGPDGPVLELGGTVALEVGSVKEEIARRLAEEGELQKIGSDLLDLVGKLDNQSAVLSTRIYYYRLDQGFSVELPKKIHKKASRIWKTFRKRTWDPGYRLLKERAERERARFVITYFPDGWDLLDSLFNTALEILGESDLQLRTLMGDLSQKDIENDRPSSNPSARFTDTYWDFHDIVWESLLGMRFELEKRGKADEVKDVQEALDDQRAALENKRAKEDSIGTQSSD